MQCFMFVVSESFTHNLEFLVANFLVSQVYYFFVSLRTKYSQSLWESQFALELIQIVRMKRFLHSKTMVLVIDFLKVLKVLVKCLGLFII